MSASCRSLIKLQKLRLFPKAVQTVSCGSRANIFPTNQNRSYCAEVKKEATNEPKQDTEDVKSEDKRPEAEAKRTDTWAEAELKEKEDKQRRQKEADREQTIKVEILNASMKYVTKHGWSKLALASGAEDLGYISVVSGLFDRGGEELVLHHIKTSNKKLDAWMIEEVDRYKKAEEKLPITKFIKAATKQRLLMNEEFIRGGVWGEALALMAKPQNIPESVGCLQQVCDDIWHRAGDTSADLNWYSKRMLLAGIISSTEVFMIQDLSQNFEETWKFLDRRFEDISGVPQLGKLPQDVSGILSGLVTTARNIAGIQK